MNRLFKISTWFFSLLWLLSLAGIFISPAQLWFFALLALFFPIFSLVLILFFFILMFHQWKYVLALLLVFFGSLLVLNILGLQRNYVRHSSSQVDSTFCLVTHNVDIFKFYEKKTFDPIKWVNIYRQLQPDILCLQECFIPDTNANFIRKTFLDPLFMKDFVYYPYIEIKGRGFAGMFIGSTFPIVNKGFVFNNTPAGKKIIAIWADVRFSQTDTLRIFNVHLQSYHFNKEEREFLDMKARFARRNYLANFLGKFRYNAFYRSIQADRLLASMDSTHHEIIVAGDFNELPWSYIYRKFNNRFTDCYTRGRMLRDFKTLNFYLPLRVDYVFVQKGRIQPIFFRVIDVNLNDHYPLETRFIRNE